VNEFDPRTYGAEVSAILALDGNGARLMPLASGHCSSAKAHSLIERRTAGELFPRAQSPAAALAGLWLYFSCLDESHHIAQEIHTPDGSFWHGIMHRQEPDPGNSGYWFRRAGSHAIYPALRDAAAEIAARHTVPFGVRERWDPFAFIDFCEEARRAPGSESERLALAIQRAEWQLLFDHCARPGL
jgi:hypothetical protein